MSENVDWDAWNRNVIEEFRANEGKLGGMFEGAPMLLLRTKGAKSGEPRMTPPMYQQAGEELGSETIPVRARVAAPEEREPIYDAQKAAYSNFAEYEEKAGM